LAAVERNVHRLRSALRPGSELCAVVKADGYGHGAVQVARAAQAAGASSLAVATASEAAALRAGGPPGGWRGPIIVLGALGREELPTALAAQAELVAWTPDFLQSVCE